MIGKTLGHYRVVEQLGRGGTGEVIPDNSPTVNRKLAQRSLPDLSQETLFVLSEGGST